MLGPSFLAIQNPTYGRLANANFSRDLGSRHLPSQGTNGISDGVRVAKGSPHVLGVRHRLQVVGVDTPFIPAQVIEFVSIWDGTMNALPVHHMGASLRTTVSNSGVSITRHDVKLPAWSDVPAINNGVPIGLSGLVVEDEPSRFPLRPSPISIGAPSQRSGLAAPTLAEFCGTVVVRHFSTSVIGPGCAAPGACKPPGISLSESYHEDGTR